MFLLEAFSVEYSNFLTRAVTSDKLYFRVLYIISGGPLLT